MQIPISFESGIRNAEKESQQTTEEIGGKVLESKDKDVPTSGDTSYIRLKADYENLKKRHIKEVQQGVEREMGAFLKKLLVIYDDLERALPFCEVRSGDSKNNHDLFQGICLIHKRIENLLKESGVERIETVGKPFDPLFHEAVMVDKHSPAPANTVIGELVGGYRYRGALLRPAQVKVSA